MYNGAGGTPGSTGAQLRREADIVGGTTYTSAGIGINGLSRVRVTATRTGGDVANLALTLKQAMYASTDSSQWKPYDAPISLSATVGIPVVIEGVIASNAVRVEIENKTAATTSTVEVQIMVTPF